MFLTAFNPDQLWDPFEAIRRFREDTSNGTGRLSTGEWTYPPVNVWTGEKGAVLMAELPGFDAKNLDISAEGDLVTLKGSREEVLLGEEDTVLQREWTGGSFERSIRLPFAVDGESVEARYAKGVLVVKLPRSKKDMPRKIQVKS